jgi:Ca-activated chloride channel family protein
LAVRTDEALGEALVLALKGVQSTSVVNAALNRAQNTALTRPGDGSKQSNLVSVDEAVNASTTQPKQRLLVLISDGQSKISRLDLAEAVNYAQWLKVPIYTIGIGASHAVADTRAFTGLLYQPLESQSLKWLAAQTQGAYYQVGSGQDLQTVLQKIEQAAGTPLQTVPHTARTTELYYQPLQWVLLGLMLSVALSGWRVIRGDKG